ncbi:MAG: hypothetical protein GYA24_19520 [Candidatus Lokiarchaeota archaeon]|nr:hypothetical protein [Candidatus Lokiarchaeota archaeon]
MTVYHLIVDGSNIANSVKNERKKAKLRNLILLMQYLDEIGSSYPIEYEILVDATLQYTIDDRAALEELIKRGRIHQCPAGRKADEYILEFYQMESQSTIIISNDRFKDYNFNPAHDFALCDYMIIFDRIISPKLKAFTESIKLPTVSQIATENAA